MIDGISGYIKNIAFFLIFTSFIGIILPGGKYKKYIDIVLGLVLIIVTLEPAAALVFGSSRPLDKILNEITSSLDYGITATGWDTEEREKLITESFGQRIRPQLESLVSGYDFILEDMDFSVDIDTGEIASLSISVSEAPVQPTPVPFIRVEKVRVQSRDADVELAESIESGEIIRLKKGIADFYNIPIDNIHIGIHRKN